VLLDKLVQQCRFGSVPDMAGRIEEWRRTGDARPP